MSASSHDEAAPRGRLRSRAVPAVLAAIALLAVVWFGGLGHRKLIKPDEGRYAEIPREMVATGDWLTPRLNGLKYFEKPPLQYWTTALAYEAFGASEWTSRLWTALTGFAGVIVVGWTAARVHDRRTGLFAATVTASTLAYVLLAHFNTLDMGLTFFMTTTWCAVLLARDARRAESAVDAHCGGGPRGRSASRGWMLVAWAALALAVLSKGPVAVVLCGAALVGYVAVSRDWTMLRMLDVVRGLALFALIAGPWFVAVSKANPDFAHFFFIHEHVERFLTTEHRREGPWWYFVPVVVAGSLPWLSLLPGAIVAGWRRGYGEGFAPERLLIVYVALVFAFFSLSGSKLPSYVLPLFPACAWLVARRLATIDARTLRQHLVFVAIVAIAVGIAFCYVPLDSSDSDAAVVRFRTAAAICMAAWLAATLVSIGLAARSGIAASILVAGCGALVAWTSLVLSHEILGREMSTYDLARETRPSIAPDTTIYSVGMFDHAFDFYLRHTVTLVGFRDELDFGLTAEPDRGIDNFAHFIARWNAEPDALAIMGDDVFATLTAAHVPMRVVARDARRIVVARGVVPAASTTSAGDTR